MVVRAQQKDASSCSIASRLSQRKRRRDDDVDEETKQQQKQRHADDIFLIREKLGDYQHHGTGNPLSLRSPTTPKDQAVQNLANIIKMGVLGLSSTNSTPQLKTERGSSRDGCFWTTRLRLAGSYGWTGIILPSDADSSKPFPVVEKASWFLLQHENEQTQLESLLSESQDRWNSVRDRVVTISQLAEHLRCSRS